MLLWRLSLTQVLWKLKLIGASTSLPHCYSTTGSQIITRTSLIDWAGYLDVFMTCKSILVSFNPLQRAAAWQSSEQVKDKHKHRKPPQFKPIKTLNCKSYKVNKFSALISLCIRIKSFYKGLWNSEMALQVIAVNRKKKKRIQKGWRRLVCKGRTAAEELKQWGGKEITRDPASDCVHRLHWNTLQELETINIFNTRYSHFCHQLHSQRW